MKVKDNKKQALFCSIKKAKDSLKVVDQIVQGSNWLFAELEIFIIFWECAIHKLTLYFTSCRKTYRPTIFQHFKANYRPPVCRGIDGGGYKGTYTLKILTRFSTLGKYRGAISLSQPWTLNRRNLYPPPKKNKILATPLCGMARMRHLSSKKGKNE